MKNRQIRLTKLEKYDISEKDFIYKKFEWGCIYNKILKRGAGENMLYSGWIKNFKKEYRKKLGKKLLNILD